MMPLPDGMHGCDSSDFSGWDRLPWIVENEDEVVFWYRESAETGNLRPRFTCGYCDARYQSESCAGAVRWFHAHDCQALELAEQHAIVLDLTPLLTTRSAGRSPSTAPKALQPDAQQEAA